jgi:hypothetical protein
MLRRIGCGMRGRYERTEARRGSHYERKVQTKAGDQASDTEA